MKYIIKSDEISPVITTDPVSYVYQWEPIDVIDGQCKAWDEHATLYHFGPTKEFKEKKIIGDISWQEIGEWNKCEPFLIKIKDNDEKKLRKVLTDFLKFDEENKNKREFWQIFKKDVQAKKTDFDKLTLHELISLAEKIEVD